MTNVTPLRPPKTDDLIFVCTNCQCTTWVLRPDVIECAHCGGQTTYGAEWRRDDWPEPIEVEKTTDGTRSVVDFTTSGAARKSVLAQVDDTTTFMIVVYDSGEVKTWGGGTVKTEEQRTWAHDRVQVGLKTLGYTDDSKLDEHK